MKWKCGGLGGGGRGEGRALLACWTDDGDDCELSCRARHLTLSYLGWLFTWSQWSGVFLLRRARFSSVICGPTGPKMPPQWAWTVPEPKWNGLRGGSRGFPWVRWCSQAKLHPPSLLHNCCSQVYQHHREEVQAAAEFTDIISWSSESRHPRMDRHEDSN